MRPVSATSFAILGASVIALSFGLARFAFGLFVPQIRNELGLSADVMGLVGALTYISIARMREIRTAGSKGGGP